MSYPIQTVSGVWIAPNAATEENINIDDIAHALSMLCRFNGHCRIFYSVAQHSVLVSEILEEKGFPREVLLAGLMHDAHEAYLGDMPSPLKKIFKDYGPVADDLQKIIERKYSIVLSEDEAKQVKNSDFHCFYAEVRDLMNPQGWSWPADIFKWERVIVPCGQEQAKNLFLSRFTKLLVG